MAKTYLKASAKARETNFGQVIKIGVNVDELIRFAQQHKNDRGWVNLEVSPRKETGPYGDTHSVSLDDFVKGSGKTAPSTAAGSHSTPPTADEIPF